MPPTPVKIAINGYGRIGRVLHRVLLDKFSDSIDLVAINASSSTDLKGWMYLFKYDTSYGPLNRHTIQHKPQTSDFKDLLGYLIIDEKQIPVFSQTDPQLLPWDRLKVNTVVECTGEFLTQQTAALHLKAGAKKILISAPAKDDSISTSIISINERDTTTDAIISNASCTTNCVSPVAQIIHENFGIQKAMMTTIHAYTSDQRLQDGGHKDYRRARAAASNIVPTSTGATTAITQAIPELKGRFSGLAIRVPVTVGSLSDFTFLVEKDATTELVNEAFVKASKSEQYKGIVQITTEPLVSSDIIGNSHSAIVDLSLTQVVDKTMVKIIAWYDNEYAYAHRLAEQVLMIGKS